MAGDICGVNGSTGVQPRITRGAGFFRQRFLALEGQQRDGDAVGLRQARHHVAITTVIAMTAEDQPVLAGRVVGSRPLKSRFPARIISSNSVRPRLSAAAFPRAAPHLQAR